MSAPNLPENQQKPVAVQSESPASPRSKEINHRFAVIQQHAAQHPETKGLWQRIISALLKKISAKTRDQIYHQLEWLARWQRFIPLLLLPFVFLFWFDTHTWGYWLLGLILLTMGGLGLFWSAGIWCWWQTRTKYPATDGQGHLLVSCFDDNAWLIHDQCLAWDKEANNYRDRRRSWAIGVALLSPLAVALLAAQITLTAHDSDWAKLWISLEILFIAVAAYTVYQHWPIGDAHDTWIPARLRAELFRRELFLYLARLGPYLHSENLDDDVQERIRCIGQWSQAWKTADEDSCKEEAASRNEYSRTIRREKLNRLISLQTINQAGGYWRNDLEDRWRPNQKERKDKPARFNEPIKGLKDIYLHHRLLSQRDGYFGPTAKKHQLIDEAYENMAALTLTFAGFLAVMHLILLFHHQPGDTKPDLIAKIVEFLALIMPPLGVGMLALRAAFESHRLHHSYRDQMHQLDELYDLYPVLASDQQSPDDAHDLQRFVLHTETLLSHELRRWWLIVWPEQPKAS